MFSFAWWLSLSVGFLSLSQEILWVRLLGFAYGNVPHAFSFVLANFLVGIALGAAYGKRCCERSANLWMVAGVTLAVAGVSDALIPWLAPYVIRPEANWSLPLAAVLVIVTAGIKSVLFPIAHHLGSVQSGGTLGRSVSKIYFGNIIGSTLGPLVTGFVLMDFLTVEECFTLIAATAFVMAALCMLKAADRRLAIGVAAFAAVVLIAARPQASSAAIGAFAQRQDGREIRYLSQNRNGVIHVLSEPELGDIVLGGNIYDGRASVDVQHNANRLDRLYLLSLLHANPERVLIVGLSTGAWARAIQGFPGVRTIDIIEINPGYIELIGRYPHIAPLLEDPRVRVFVDDGRRWLKRNPGEQYDLIVQNTTFHWRAYSTSLLSREYFTEVRSHLRPGGIFAANTTGSYDAFLTAQSVFPHAYRYANFLYAGETARAIPAGGVAERLATISLPLGGYLVNPGEELPRTSVAARLLRAKLEPVDALLNHASGGSAEVITDDNMLPEYRHGRRFGPVKFSLLFLPPEAPRLIDDDP